MLGLKLLRILFYLREVVLQRDGLALAKHDARGPAVVVDAYAGYEFCHLPDHGLPVVRRDLLVIPVWKSSGELGYASMAWGA